MPTKIGQIFVILSIFVIFSAHSSIPDGMVLAGDPSVFYNGTIRNTRLPISYAELQGQWRIRITVIPKYVMTDPKQESPIQKITAFKNNLPFTVKSTPRGFSLNSDDHFAPKLFFTVTPEETILAAVHFLDRVARIDERMELIHYSVSNDKNAFNVMLHSKYEGLEGLIILNYTRGMDLLNPPLSKLNHSYLLGLQLKRPWPKESTLRLSLCKLAANAQKIAISAVAEWVAALDKNLDLQIFAVDLCPPFSDLNFHGVYLIDNYLTSPMDQYSALGQTFSSSAPQKNLIIDSDVLIYTSSLNKYLVNVAPKGITDTTLGENKVPALVFKNLILHEVGHFLGLGHTNNNSVMDENVTIPLRVDVDEISALRELY